MFKRYYFISAMRYKDGEQVGWNHATLETSRFADPVDVVTAWRKEAEDEYPGCKFHVTTFNRL